MTTPPPRRAHHVEIHAGGDTEQDLIDAIREIADRLDSEDVIPSVSGIGSSSRGYRVTFDYDPDMTHDRYIAANRAWLEARRAEAVG
ncbi:hypothetical protein AB0J48_20670 [Nocardia salmonicida]|uniref:hypothetical protein n=1 Tax=Nocardia salmonicida TaxID=53431 RepID=UPI0034477301